jgi:DNA-binding XRE family transcriptional regulator
MSQPIRDGELEAAFYQELGRKLELRRHTQGMAQLTLAANLGVHRNTVMRWESGEMKCPLWMLLRAADLLGCNHLFLMPSRDYVWGLYRDYLRERDPGKKAVQKERDPALKTIERMWA